MAADLNGQSLAIWNNLKPMIDEEIKSQTKGMVQRRKAKVTTAPSLSTGTIGVTEPFGTEYFIPFNTNLTTASVGDFVWVEFMYGATNAFASMYASADTKNWTVGGVLDVTPRRTSAYLSTAGWYRVLTYVSSNAADVAGANGLQIDFVVNRGYSNTTNETHRVTLSMTYNGAKFVDESSRSNYLGITKIRYTTNTTGTYKFGYVDIYYGLSNSNPVYVDFTVHQAATSIQAAITASDLTSVASSPADETVLTEYTLHAKAPMADVSNLITWDTTNYIASSSGLQVYLDGPKLVLTGSLQLKTGVNVQGAFIGTLDSSIAVKSNVWLMAFYTADPASAVARPIAIYTHDSTRLRIANEATNTTGNLGSPTANNAIRINSIIPLA